MNGMSNGGSAPAGEQPTEQTSPVGLGDACAIRVELAVQTLIYPPTGHCVTGADETQGIYCIPRQGTERVPAREKAVEKVSGTAEYQPPCSDKGMKGRVTQYPGGRCSQ